VWSQIEVGLAPRIVCQQQQQQEYQRYQHATTLVTAFADILLFMDWFG